jgi:cell division protein FtsZ
VPPAPAPHPADDELVLGADTMVSPPAAPRAPAPAQPAAYAAPTPAPAPAADEGGARRRWLAPGSDTGAIEPPAPAPRVKLGGTLFERMSNAARGTPREEEAKPADPLDIPRFLHRQNNQ